MATVEQLLARVKSKIDEPDYTDEDFFGLLNEGLSTVTEMLVFPGLQATASVNTATNASVVALPANYQKGLYAASFTDGTRPTILSSLAQLIELAGNYYEEVGDINCICEHGANLAYDRIPAAAVAIKLHYYRKAAEITDATTVLDGITPAVLARVEKAIVHYAAHVAIDDRDNGVAKTDTNHHLDLFNSIVDEIRRTTSVGVSRPAAPVVKGCFR